MKLISFLLVVIFITSCGENNINKISKNDIKNKKLNDKSKFEVEGFKLFLGEVEYRIVNISDCKGLTCTSFTLFSKDQGVFVVQKRILKRTGKNVLVLEDQIVSLGSAPRFDINWNQVKEYKVDWGRLKEKLLEQHYFATFRCRSSKYWSAAYAKHPLNGGNIVLSNASFFNIDQEIEIFSGFEVDVSAAEVRRVSSFYSISLKHSQMVLFAPGLEDLISYENPFVLNGANEFSQKCDAHYVRKGAKYVGYGMYEPAYDEGYDAIASEDLDKTIRGDKYFNRELPEYSGHGLAVKLELFLNAEFPFYLINEKQDKLWERINEK